MTDLYPSRFSAAKRFATLLTRGPLLCALVAQAAQPVYLRLVHWLKWSDPAVFALVTGVAHSFTWVVANGIFSCLDYKQWLQKYKLPRKKSQAPSSRLIVSTLVKTALGHAMGPILAFYIAKYIRKLPAQDVPLPSLTKLWFHFSMATLTNEVLFYSAHRLFHEIPLLYRVVHKQHHQYVGSISIAAEWATLPEEILANFIPTLGYLFFARAPNLVFVVWLVNRLWETFESHSGYCFRGTLFARMGLLNSERSEFHDYHHTANVGNFGTHVFMDFLFGTMTSYLQSKHNDEAQGRTT